MTSPWFWITLFMLCRWGKLAGFRPMIDPQSSATTFYNYVSKIWLKMSRKWRNSAVF